MSRRHAAEKREVLPDAKYGDRVLTKFMNNLMVDGKKSVAEHIVYSAMERVEARLKRSPIDAFREALENVKPSLEVRSRRVGVPAIADIADRSPAPHPLPLAQPGSVGAQMGVIIIIHPVLGADIDADAAPALREV